MNNLPYFKFSPTDWLGGDIQICSHAAKGILIDIMAKLWIKGGYIQGDEDYLCALIGADKQSFSNALAELKRCQALLQAPEKGWYIEFILEQLEELKLTHNQRVNAGRKGGKARTLQAGLKQAGSKAQASLKRPSSIKKRKEKNNITWLTPYFDLWKEHIGEPPAGRLAKAMKPVHDAHGPERTAKWFEAYLKEADPQYVSPENFAARYKQWADKKPKKGAIAP